MKYFIVPLNELTGIKELRTSKKRHFPDRDGPLSGIIYENRPIEETQFPTIKEAQKIIQEVAPWLAP